MRSWLIICFTLIIVLSNLMSTLAYTSSDVIRNCTNGKCIAKCCPDGQYFGLNSCEPYHEVLDFSEIAVYDSRLYKTSKKIYGYFKIIPYGMGPEFTNLLNDYFIIYAELDRFNTYLTQDAILYIENPNTFSRWIVRNSSYFCVDYLLPDNVSDSPIPAFWVFMNDLNVEESKDQDWWSYFVTAALIISLLCLILVLVVYALLPDLRNLCGLILMAYVGSLLMAYTALATLRTLVFFPIEQETCLYLTLAIYFSILSSFFWMNVMSFDIWWTFRGYAKARPIHRRGEHFKFIMYCLYAWGTPLAMTIFVAVIYHMDLTHIPWFIKPNLHCFFADDEKMLYLYIPMLIIIISNWIFFLMTAYNVWRLSRNTGVLDSAAAGKRAEHRNQRNRFMVYVKLCVIMGVTWVLEVISYFTPAIKMWHLSDLYHGLIGSIIFLIFVCKKKILNKLKKRLQSFKQQQWDTYTKRHSTSTTDSEFSTQETPLQVCPNPKGTDYYKSY